MQKILIRSIPDDVFKVIEVLAEKEGRSLEGQARYALCEMAKPVLERFEESIRKKEISKRLRTIIEFPNTPSTPSELAEKIGETHGEFMDKAFLGLVEPSFEQLNAVADLAGVNRQWLLHGTGSMLFNEWVRLPEDAEKAVSWLLSFPDVAGFSGDKIKTLSFVRSLDSGSMSIVKESIRGRYVIYHTPIYINEEIGNGGMNMLICLFNTFKLLWSVYVGRDSRFEVAGNEINVESYLLSPKYDKELSEGNTHPQEILKNKSMWWEDIWDAKMTNDRVTEYWPGFFRLRDSVMENMKSRNK